MADFPDLIGRYQIRSQIGQGGMGTLLLAWDPMLDREVAIKLLKEDDDELRERFAREARSAAKLRHPNVVTIFDVGVHDGRPFIAMEYVKGETLAAIIREQKPLPTPDRLQLIEGLCDGLAFAHRAGIVHRDVKPANVMVETEGGVKILDFGIARASESSRLTRAGMLIGTLNYMSPEQVMGKKLDHRSDVFAVGLVLYEMLAYSKAFPGKALADLIDKIVRQAPPPLSDVRRGLDPDVIRIVDRAIEKNPDARYQDLRAMQRDLEVVRRRLETAADATQILRVPAEFLVAEAKRKAEEERLAAEAKRKAEEERLVGEAKRKAEEERLAAETKRKAEEERLVGEAKRKAEEERLVAEAKRKAEEERLAEIRRKEEAERAAREKRIDTGVAAAREEIGKQRFDEAAARLQSLERAEGPAPEIGAARADIDGAKAAMEASRVRMDIDGLVAKGAESLAAGDFAAAQRSADAALALDSASGSAGAFARSVKDAVHAEEKRKKDEAKEARRKERALAAEQRKARLARARSAAMSSLRQRLAASGAVARRAVQRTQASSKSVAARFQSQVAAWRAPQWGAAGGVILVIAVGAYVGFRPAVTPAPQPPSVRPSDAGVPPSALVPPPVPLAEPVAVPPPETSVPPSAAPAVPSTEARGRAEGPRGSGRAASPPPGEVPTELPPSQVAMAEAARLADLLAQAGAEYDRGDRAAALRTAETVMAASPRHEPLFELYGRMQKDAYDETRQARQAADEFGDAATLTSDYRIGAEADIRASEANQAGDYPRAIRQWWAATEAFNSVAAEAKRAAAATPVIDIEPMLAIIRDYARALQELDVNDVRRVYPSVDGGALRNEFRAIERQQVVIANPRAVAAASGSVTIRCTIIRTLRIRNASADQQLTAEVEFLMRQDRGRWIIAELR